MPVITSDQTFNYTEGQLMIKIRTMHDQGGVGAEYTVVEFRTAEGEEIAPEICFHTDDMRVIAQAISEYFMLDQEVRGTPTTKELL